MVSVEDIITQLRVRARPSGLAAACLVIVEAMQPIAALDVNPTLAPLEGLDRLSNGSRRVATLMLPIRGY
jgi:hypothetical protein